MHKCVFSWFWLLCLLGLLFFVKLLVFCKSPSLWNLAWCTKHRAMKCFCVSQHLDLAHKKQQTLVQATRQRIASGLSRRPSDCKRTR